MGNFIGYVFVFCTSYELVLDETILPYGKNIYIVGLFGPYIYHSLIRILITFSGCFMFSIFPSFSETFQTSLF